MNSPFNSQNISWHKDDAGIATVTFDRQDSGANIFDRNTLLQLAETTTAIRDDRTIKSVIFTSAKKSIFIAGADINALAALDDAGLTELLTLGQQTLDAVTKLRVPTVAAIHGACVGGGFELALACDYRIASTDRATRIGLPEIQLGILPGWGGCTRLPKLIGLEKALSVILPGKVLAAAAAAKIGLVDALVPRENILNHAQTFFAKGKRKTKNFGLRHSKAAVRLIHKMASEKLVTKTRGLYPAPPLALDICCQSLHRSTADSLAAEREAINKLARTPATAELLRIFHLVEHAKKLRPNDLEPHPIATTAVIGAGVMGAGIAYQISSHGTRVTLADIDDAALARGYARLTDHYATARKKHILDATEVQTCLDRVLTTTNPAVQKSADLIIEAATEDLAIKQKIFASLSASAKPDSILATNTSALPLAKIAASVSDPSRLVGLHFFNPVPRMKLVEIVRGEHTSDQTLATATAFVRSIGKLPVIVADSPGFLVNRILLPYLCAAGELYNNGTSAEVIDNAMLDFGMPMGPLRLLDEVGLDVALHVAGTLAAAFPDRVKIPTILEKMVGKKLLGKKTKSGFYAYASKKPTVNYIALDLRTKSEAPDIMPTKIASDLTEAMSHEAKLCLDEKIAARAADIDFAMIIGTGYAPFRGGPLRHADAIGLFGEKIY